MPDEINENAVNVFETPERQQPKISWIDRQDGAGLGWGEAIGLAYVAMYEATGDTQWLESPARRIDAVPERRDDSTGSFDDVRQRVVPALAFDPKLRRDLYAFMNDRRDADKTTGMLSAAYFSKYSRGNERDRILTDLSFRSR